MNNMSKLWGFKAHAPLASLHRANTTYTCMSVPLPRGWIQEIKRMQPVLIGHGLFLTWTQNFVIHSIYTSDEILANPTPCSLLPAFLLTWRTSFLAHPLLPLVCYQLPTLCCFSHPNTLHRSSYNIYTDINNIRCPRLTQWVCAEIAIQHQWKVFQFMYV